MKNRFPAKPTLTAVLCLALSVSAAFTVAPSFAQQGPAAAASDADRMSQPPGPADLDTNFWVLVRNSNDPDALRSYIDSFPSGKFVSEARQKISALRDQQGKTAKVEPSSAPSGPAPVTPAPAAPPAAESKDLALALQRELKRVGCLSGEADGVWGGQSREAMKSFVRHAKLGIAGEEPNVSVLDAATAAKSRVCPLVCDEGEKVVGDRCVAAAKPRPVQRREEARQPSREPRRAWAGEESAPRGGNPNAGKRICFGARPNELVTCQ